MRIKLDSTQVKVDVGVKLGNVEKSTGLKQNYSLSIVY